MELVGSNGYDVAPSVNNNWRLMMNFMTSNGLSYKNSTDTTNDVRGQVYADLIVYILSSDGVGPLEIVIVPTTDPFSYQVTYTIYMLFEPFGGSDVL